MIILKRMEWWKIWWKTFVLEFGEEDDCGSDNEEELMDDEDRRLIDNAIRQTTTDTVTPTPTICNQDVT